MTLFIKKTSTQGGASVPPVDAPDLGGAPRAGARMATPVDVSDVVESHSSNDSSRGRFGANQDVSDVELHEQSTVHVPPVTTGFKFAAGLGRRPPAPDMAEPVQPVVDTRVEPQILEADGEILSAPAKPRATLNESFAQAQPMKDIEPVDAPRKSIFGSVLKGDKPKNVKVSSEAASGKKSLLGRLPKLGKSPSEPKAANPSHGPRRSKEARTSLHLMVRLDAVQTVCYEVTATGLNEVDIKDTSTVASFTPEDHRFVVAAKTSNRSANDLALSESVGEQVRLINTAKTYGAIYATAAERLEEFQPRLGPGYLLLEKILSSSETPAASHTVCLLLADRDTGISLAILYLRTPDGTVSEPQVTANIADLSFTLRQFQSARGLTDESQVMQISNQELVAAANELQLYPSDAEWNGISIRTLLSSAVLAAAAVAVGTSGFAGYQYQKLQSAKTAVQRTVAKTTSIDKENQALIADSLHSFGRVNSIDLPRLSERAAALWVPRSTMTVLASASTESYSISIPLTTGGFFNNRPSVLTEINGVEIQQFLKITPPEGCSKNAPGVSGGVNVIQVTVSCEAGSSSIGRYRLD